ncbi:hypothetical protein DB313_05740 (plasmid) [Borrelia turcica IST7]|uniref:DUF3890 domain-containing protein n=1 Tax=Borrelia turcica IST7 TaxID=1104446 RepID=A0A386PNC9_9SPIR|nr:DUF3890 domain-containing protein [Borrelia turcica]AYE37001.1 hypothetical protein DB313_05740 [Borrelia turcica IST7]
MSATTNSIDEIHRRILELLSLNAEILSIENLKTYIHLLEDILLAKRVEPTLLSSNESFLLVYYFVACQLIKKGTLTSFTFNRIKSEKLGELAVEYSDPARNKEIDSKDFCNEFNELLDDLTKRGYKRVKPLGVI